MSLQKWSLQVQGWEGVQLFQLCSIFARRPRGTCFTSLLAKWGSVHSDAFMDPVLCSAVDAGDTSVTTPDKPLLMV